MMSSKTPFEPLDWSKPTPEHLKLLFISGAGFFADAYDLFAISIALVFLKQVWSLTASEISLISSAALFGAVIGPSSLVGLATYSVGSIFTGGWRPRY